MGISLAAAGREGMGREHYRATQIKLCDAPHRFAVNLISMSYTERTHTGTFAYSHCRDGCEAIRGNNRDKTRAHRASEKVRHLLLLLLLSNYGAEMSALLDTI